MLVNMDSPQRKSVDESRDLKSIFKILGTEKDEHRNSTHSGANQVDFDVVKMK
jgi:hypothetical protein